MTRTHGYGSEFYGPRFQMLERACPDPDCAYTHWTESDSESCPKHHVRLILAEYKR